MKYFISLVLIISFVAITIFSFAIFNHDMSHANNGCLAYALAGVACPTNIIAFALHHVAIIKTLSKTLISPIFHSLFTLVFLFSASISLFLFFQSWLFPKFNSSHSQRKFTRWLALLENSPAA